MTRRALLSCVALVLSACSASRPSDLADRLWVCEDPVECADGFGCADGNVIAPDVCRPTCDPADPASCPDGVCTARGECLRTCTLMGDGTSSTPCPEAHVCVRTDVFSQEGLCVATTSCSTNADCEAGTRCFNDVFSLPRALPGIEYHVDRFYCLADPAEGLCPAGYAFVPGQMGSAGSCLPLCGEDDSRCPPAMTCLRDFGYLFGITGSTPCYLGIWGLPCRDDAQCLAGRCRDIGEGRRACTETCSSVERLAPFQGCTGLRDFTPLLPETAEFFCEAGHGPEPICVPYGGVGAPCNDETRCIEGTECTVVDEALHLSLCTRSCTQREDCELPSVPEPRRADVACVTNLCVHLLPAGSACELDWQCVSGRCGAGPRGRVCLP